MAGTVWAGVVCALFVVQLSVILTALVMAAALTQASRQSGEEAQQSSLVAEVVGADGSILGVVVVVVVLVTVGSAVSARRRQIALWLLAGASPGQVVRMILLQVVVVSLATSVPAAGVAVAVIDPALRLVSDGGIGPANPVATTVSLWAMVLGGAVGVVLAVLGAWRAAVVAGRLPPVDALRSGHEVYRPLTAARVVRYALSGVILGLAVLLGSTIVSPRDAGTLVTTPIFVLLLTLVLVALLAPAVLPRVVWLWTRLPLPWAAWIVARDTSVARSARLAGTITPLALCIGLVLGALTIADTMVATTAALAPGTADGLSTRPEIVGLVIVFGLPVVVAAGGALGAMLITARGRAVDLALPRLVGATAGQSWWQAFCEGVILTVTSLVVAVVCVGAALVVQSIGLVSLYGGVVVVIPWTVLVVLGAVLAALGGMTTVATTQHARHRPPHRVISELLGE